MGLGSIQKATTVSEDQSTIQNINQTTGRFSTLRLDIGFKISLLVLAIFGLLIPLAEATPAGYAACCAACGTVTGIASNGALLPLSVGACIKACLPVFAAPFP